MKLIIFTSFFILKSGYICHVKFKRIIALNLLFILSLSSAGGALISSHQQRGFKSTLEQTPNSTQLIAITQDACHEFRETAKVNASAESTSSSESSHFIRGTSLHSFKSIRIARYNSYLQKQLLQKHSSKLYLDQGSLII